MITLVMVVPMVVIGVWMNLKMLHIVQLGNLQDRADRLVRDAAARSAWVTMFQEEQCKRIVARFCRYQPNVRITSTRVAIRRSHEHDSSLINSHGKAMARRVHRVY